MRRIYQERPTHSIRIPDDVHEQLALLAAASGVSMTAIVQELVRREFQRKKPSPSHKPRVQRKRLLRWTPEAVLEAIHSRLEKGQPLNSWAVQLSDAGLWEGGCRVFGSWDATLTAAGIVKEERSCGQPAKGLKRVRLHRKLTQIQLAQTAGTTQSHISTLENERAHPTRTMLGALALALHCNQDELLKG